MNRLWPSWNMVVRTRTWQSTSAFTLDAGGAAVQESCR